MKSLFFAVAVLATGTACSSSKAVDERFELTFNARSDDAAPLAGVTFAAGKTELGTSGPSGAFSVSLKGTEGQVLPVRVTCPTSYKLASEPQSVRLAHTRRLDQTTLQPLAIDVVCARSQRDVVLVVRTDAPNLPISIDGKRTATTAEDGTAHVLLQRDSDVSRLTVALDTTDQPKLRPQNPSRTFELHGKDTIVVLDQSFANIPSSPAHARRAPARFVPYRIQ